MKHPFFTPKWIAGHLLAGTLVTIFILFGFWQLRRHNERASYNALLNDRLSSAALPYDDLTSRFDLTAPAPDADADAIFYRRASLRGSFDPAGEVLLRSRAYGGQPGYHLLTPFAADTGQHLLIDRGWVPYESRFRPPEATRPPEGEVTLEGILFPPQRQPDGPMAFMTAQDPAEGTLQAVFYVNPERLEQQLPYGLEPLYLGLSAQTPAQAGELPIIPPPPEISGGPHLSYAFQWFGFALIGLVGYPILLVRVAREGNHPAEPEPDLDGQPAL